MKKLLNALRFMTFIPFPGYKHADLTAAGKSASFFPVAGLFIGGLLFLTAFAAGRFLSVLPAAAMVTVVWVIITGGLHLDGLADLADGIGGGWDTESRLRIMKDSSIGTYGALALGVVLLLKTAFLYELIDSRQIFLIFVPAAARGTQVAAIRIFKPARNEGFGYIFKSSVGTADAVKAAAVSVIAGTAFLGIYGIIIPAASFLWILAAGKWISRRLGGLNGDAYGALCELTEVLILILLIVLVNTPLNLTSGWIEWLSSFL